MGAFPFGFATNFSWLSAMLDASSSSGVVLVVMSPVKTGFSGFFLERTGFSNREQRKPVKTWKPVKQHPSSMYVGSSDLSFLLTALERLQTGAAWPGSLRINIIVWQRRRSTSLPLCVRVLVYTSVCPGWYDVMMAGFFSENTRELGAITTCTYSERAGIWGGGGGESGGEGQLSAWWGCMEMLVYRVLWITRRANDQTIRIRRTELPQSHLPYKINYHEHMRCSMQFFNRMTAQVLYFQWHYNLAWISRRLNWNQTVEFSRALHHTKFETNRFTSVSAVDNVSHIFYQITSADISSLNTACAK